MADDRTRHVNRRLGEPPPQPELLGRAVRSERLRERLAVAEQCSVRTGQPELEQRERAVASPRAARARNPGALHIERCAEVAEPARRRDCRERIEEADPLVLE